METNRAYLFQRKIVIRLVLLSLITSLSFTVSCALDSNGAPSQLGLATLGVTAFENSVYNTITSQKCVGCHNGTQSPGIALPTVALAREAALGYVNFDRPSASKLVTKTKDGHCGGNCGTDGSEMEEMIQKWWNDGESRVANLAKGVQLPAQTIPTGLPVGGNNFVDMVWNDIPGMPGAKFELSVQYLDNLQQAYVFARPRLTWGNHAHVQRLELLLNGNLSTQAATWTTMDRVVNGGSGALLSSSRLIILTESVGSDVIAPIFAILREAQAISCRSLADFTSFARPRLAADCFQCHNGNGSATAKARFYMDNTDDAALCDAAILRANLINIDDSPILKQPLLGANGHPREPNGFDEPEAADVKKWLDEEKKALP